LLIFPGGHPASPPSFHWLTTRNFHLCGSRSGLFFPLSRFIWRTWRAVPSFFSYFWGFLVQGAHVRKSSFVLHGKLAPNWAENVFLFLNPPNAREFLPGSVPALELADHPPGPGPQLLPVMKAIHPPVGPGRSSLTPEFSSVSPFLFWGSFVGIKLLQFPVTRRG